MTYGVEDSVDSLPKSQLNGGLNSFTHISPSDKVEDYSPKLQLQRNSEPEVLPTDNLATCLDGATSLAASLNHPHAAISHVIVAMSLDENGRHALNERGIDHRLAHANCLQAVVKIDPICPGLSQDDIHPTHELQAAMDRATNIASKRDPQHRSISIDDLVNEFFRDGPDSAAKLVTADAPPEEDELQVWQREVSQSLQRIEAEIAAPRQAPTGSGQLRRLMTLAGVAAVSISAATLMYFYR